MDRVTIPLERGEKGLGFNIVGGTDFPKTPGDYGIYVSKIKEVGAAYTDGRLQVGDKIVEVNGTSLEKVKHQDAVNEFLNAGNPVTLVVIPRHKVKQSTRTALKIVVPLFVIGLGAAIGIALIIAKRKANVV